MTIFRQPFLRNPQKRPPVKKIIETWILSFAINYAKRGKRLKLPRWIDRSDFLDFSSEEEFKFNKLNKWKDNYVFDPIKYVFLDFLKVEDAYILADNILKLRHKGTVSTFISDSDVYSKIERNIKGLEGIYKGEAYGNILSLKPNGDRYDYIDYINVNYQKTEQFFIILQFEVYPSKKFLDTYYEIFRSDSFIEKELSLNTFDNIFKRKSLIYTVSNWFKYPVHNMIKHYNSLRACWGIESHW